MRKDTQQDQHRRLEALAAARHQGQETRRAESKALYGAISEAGTALSRSLGIESKALAKVLGYWTRHLPFEDREDGIQEMTLQLLEDRPSTPGLAFVVCRAWVRDWYRARKTDTESLEEWREREGERGLSEATVAVVEWEAQADGRIEAQRLWGLLPERIKGIVAKRLSGRALAGAERVALHAWTGKHGWPLLARG